MRLEFHNRKVQSLSFSHEVKLQGQEVVLNEVPAFPNGSWLVDILPAKHRHKRVPLEVRSNQEAEIKQSFFIDPGKVKAVFPPELENDPRYRRLWEAIPFSAQTGLCFVNLEDEQKAGLLNLYAKMSDQKVNSYSTKY